MPDQYVSVKVPNDGSTMRLEAIEFVVRDENGSTLARGTAVVETSIENNKKTVVMSPEMVIAVFGDPTMQHLYEKYDQPINQALEGLNKAEAEYDKAMGGLLIHRAMNEEMDGPFEDLSDQSEIVDAKATAYSVFKDAINKQSVVQEEDDNVEKRTAEQWCEEYGVDIADPDGWRHPDAPAWDEPITLADFYQRVSQSTTRVVGEERLSQDASKLNN